MNGQTKNLYAFGPFQFDPEERLLRREGTPVPLPPKVADTLFFLVQNAGHLVDKEELIKRVWPDAFVEEGNLNKNIFVLRKTLGQWDGGREYIETIPKRGYRFVASVDRVRETGAGSGAQAPAGAYLIGKKVSHYRVLELLGGGGMGLIYRAEDLKLGRRVALKFLPEELAGDPISLQRFEREARAASALNHPNICTIYGIEEYDKQPFIAMELLEGQTLRDLISSTQPSSDPQHALSLENLLDIAIQVSDGLAAAHSKGIVHRDVKPANIFVTTHGQAKILDFGLAKLQESDIPERSASGKDQAQREWNPYLTLTRTGVAIGTAGYMSPEQVRSEKLDARTDLFSLGMVLYEMATGRRAFAGDTAPILRDAILNCTPTPVRELNSKVPAKLESIVNKALEKNREARYQSAAKIRDDLQNLRREMAPKHSGARAWILIASFCALLALIGAAWWFTHRKSAPKPEIKQRQLTANSPENAVVSGVISADGKYLAYSDRQGIHIKSIATGETQNVPQPPEFKGLEVDWGFVPTWPRDSASIIANATIPGREPSIWAIPLIGGTPRKIRDRGFAFTLSRDGVWVAFIPPPDRFGMGHREMWLMKPDGRDVHKVYDAGENTVVAGAEWSPDGKRLAYHLYRVTGNKADLWIESRDLNGGSPADALIPGNADWSWSPDGRIIYSHGENISNCNLWSRRVDTATGRPIEDARKLTNWIGGCMDTPSVTADGKHLAFRKYSWQGNVYVADLDANGTHISVPRRLTLNEGRNYPSAWTADSEAVIFGSDLDGEWRVFKQPINEETSQPLTEREQAQIWGARVSPDGKWLLYATFLRDDLPLPRHDLMRVPMRGGSPELVLSTPMYDDPHCARSPSTLCVIAEQNTNNELVFTAFDPLKGRGVQLLRFPTPEGPMATGSADYLWDLSFDGRRIAILKYSSGIIHVLPLSGSAKQDVVVKGWNSLQSLNWTADGKGFFVSAADQRGAVLLNVDLHGNTHLLWQKKGSVAPWNYPAALGWLGGPSATWAVPSPDGKHLAIYDWSLSANMWTMENF
jgi:serine/threonine protein kinase